VESGGSGPVTHQISGRGWGGAVHNLYLEFWMNGMRRFDFARVSRVGMPANGLRPEPKPHQTNN
jgi:hypothetical protein